jgi:sugar-specific transcriptional regulator TrmB
LIINGSSKIGDISRRIGMHRGTVYNSLNKLIHKNFIVQSKEEKTTHYLPSNPDVFLDLLNNEKEKIEKKIDDVKIIREQIDKISKIPINRPKISMGFGGIAYLEHFLTMFRICKDKKIEYCWMGNGLGNTSKLIGESNYLKIINTKKQMKIKFRSIMNINAKPEKHKYYKPGDRYLPGEYDLSAYTWIYDNRVVIVSFESKPISVITIEDETIAKTYKNYFELLYKIAKP